MPPRDGVAVVDHIGAGERSGRNSRLCLLLGESCRVGRCGRERAHPRMAGYSILECSTATARRSALAGPREQPHQSRSRRKHDSRL